MNVVMGWKLSSKGYTLLYRYRKRGKERNA
jgi:hypothetical protein